MKKKNNRIKNPKCNWCGKPATTQTANGKYQESIGGLPINHGWYCENCFAEGLEIEKEAMGYYDESLEAKGK
jgi:hypothetical protein